jgi:hypothetical protein
MLLECSWVVDRKTGGLSAHWVEPSTVRERPRPRAGLSISAYADTLQGNRSAGN